MSDSREGTSTSILIWEDELVTPGLRTFESRVAAMEWLVENTERDHVSAIYGELSADGTSWAEHVMLDELDWPGPDYITGDWLRAPTDEFYFGYAAAITGQFSGGVNAEITEEVLRHIGEDQARFAPGPGQDRIEWRSENGQRAAYLLSDGFESGERRLGPNDFGFYEAPGWAWFKIESSKCCELVGGDNDDD